MARLQLKLDHVASLREVRQASEPDPVTVAALAELAGVDGVVVHLRGDRRHIKERDLEILRQTIKSRLTLEMAPTPEVLKVALQMKPHQVTLLPERAGERTNEGGMDCVRNRETLLKIIGPLKEANIEVALLLEPDIEQVKSAHRLDIDAVEFNAASYVDARQMMEAERALSNLAMAAKAAYKLRLGVSIGHRLNYLNVKQLRTIPEIGEYNIGYSILARGLLVGIDRAVREMVELLR